MILNNLKLIGSHNRVNIEIKAGKISRLSHASQTGGGAGLTFDNAILVPGLINSHDHLDFNLFPRLGDKIYNNYTEWGKHLHTNYRDEIARVLKIPLVLREQWGLLKNLICGVTTVVNHGARLKTRNPLITVHEQYQCIHSVQFEKRWRLKLNKPWKLKLPVVVHTGEGTDADSHQEIDQLTQWNLLNKPLVGVHGVAMSGRQADGFRALVWCPQSNHFLLNSTADISGLKKHTAILFGTDSTLTGGWNIWDHLRTARETGMLTDMELYHTLNAEAAAIWQTGCSDISLHEDADLVVLRSRDDRDNLKAFFSAGPEDILLVLHRGNIRLFDETLHTSLTTMDLPAFSRIVVNGSCKYVRGDVPALMDKIKAYYPEVNFPVTSGQP